MSTLDTALSQPIWRHLVFALLHTLWQGAAIALLLSWGLRRLPGHRQESRYLLSLVAQHAVLLAGLITWSALDYEPSRPRPQTGAAAGWLHDYSGTARPSPWPGAFTPRAVGPTQAEAGGSRWVPALAAAWLFGVGVMIARAGYAVLAAHRLTRGPRVEDAGLLAEVEWLRGALGIGRPIRVVAAQGEGPAVLGLVWPTLVLPLALLAGMPPEAVRAILAHELAHIRRHDYLLNLSQMLVEALLFFNPAVWWIGRQVRLEREACCDAAAVRLTGRPIEYSRALADWADRLRPSVPAVVLAWTGGHPPSPLLERIYRILRPGESPRGRISWAGLAALLLAGPLLLAVLWRGSTTVVHLAARALSPAERMQRLERAQEAYAAPTFEKGGKVTLKGTIRVAGGGPPSKPVAIDAITRAGNHGTSAAKGSFTDTFSFEVPAGITSILLEADGMAPATAGPFTGHAGQNIDKIEVVLDAGFPARVRVVDEQGRPVAGARVEGGLVVGGSTMYRADRACLTGDDGVATVPHASARRYSFSVSAPGFKPASSLEATPAPTDTVTLTLAHARPARGVVVTPDGTPVAGATLKPLAKLRPNQVYEFGSGMPPLGTTDGEGRFNLDALDDDTDYAILIDGGPRGRGVARGLRAGQDNLRYTIRPGLTVVGTIAGDLGALEREGGKPVVRTSNIVRLDDTEDGPYSSLQGTAPVERTQRGGRFRVEGLLPGELVVVAGQQDVRTRLERPETTLAINLATPAKRPLTRRVELRFVPPGGEVRPSGTVQVSANATSGHAPPLFEEMPLRDGAIRFDAPAPGQVSYWPRSVVGSWFESGNFPVEPGDGPLRIEVEVVPAGAIVGRVLEPDGSPAVDGISLSCRSLASPEDPRAKTISLDNVGVDSQGRFFLSPLPFGRSYVAVAGRGHARALSAPVKLEASQATTSVTIRLPRMAAAEGRIVGPDGRAAAGVPVTLRLDHPLAGTTWSPPATTDAAGRFRFDDLGSGPGTYDALVDTKKDYQPARARLSPGGPAVEIRLERGHVVEGRVVDAKSGWPIPGVELYAHPQAWRAGERYAYDPEGKTDGQGRFRFSNLPAGVCELNDRAGLTWVAPSGRREVRTDASTPLEIRATLPDWSKLRPRPPAPE